MELQAPNTVYLWQGRLLYASNAPLSTEPHVHYAASVLISATAPFELRFPETRSDGPARNTLRLRGAVLAPNTHHQMLAPESRMIVLQIDPDAAEYAPVRARLNQQQQQEQQRGGERESLARLTNAQIDALLPDLEELLIGRMNCQEARRLYADILHAAAGGSGAGAHPEAHSIDPRIQKVARKLKAELPESVAVAELAAEAGLSADRFMHLFKQELGLPVRRYLLWLRLHAAARALQQDGATLTEAAHAAGFSDQAHLSRTFKDMFGVQPSIMLGRGAPVQINFCDAE